ncbi:MAG: ATP synthase A1 subunit C [Halobacteria archaeon]
MKSDSSKDQPSNFEYVTTRVRVRKSKLFDDEDYRKLVRMQPNEIARFMEETEYGEEIDKLGSRHSGVDLIEYALHENMAKHFRDIVDWSKGDLRYLTLNYLRRFDAFNIKTVLRGIEADVDKQEIMNDMVPAGEFDEEFLEYLVDSESIEQVVDRLKGTVFGRGLEEGFRQYEEEGTLAPLETIVDHTYYEQLATREDVDEMSPRGIYQDFLKSEIDIKNIRNALRAMESQHVEIDDYFIEGGSRFDDKEALKALTENTEELTNALRESEYGNILEEAIDALEDSDSLVEFDKALDKLLLDYSQRMTNQYPLSIAPVISYILNKRREVSNIRGIARGREAGLSTEEIEEEVVL